LGELNLQDKGIERSGLHYYCFNDLKTDSVLKKIETEGRKSGAKKSEEQTAYDKQVVKLANGR